MGSFHWLFQSIWLISQRNTLEIKKKFGIPPKFIRLIIALHHIIVQLSIDSAEAEIESMIGPKTSPCFTPIIDSISASAPSIESCTMMWCRATMSRMNFGGMQDFLKFSRVFLWELDQMLWQSQRKEPMILGCVIFFFLMPYWGWRWHLPFLVLGGNHTVIRGRVPPQGAPGGFSWC